MTQNINIIVWSKEGCSYCSEVKEYLAQQQIDYQTVDVTNHDAYRDILDVKYGVRHVPVVEIGKNNVYEGVIEVGLQYLKKALESVHV